VDEVFEVVEVVEVVVAEVEVVVAEVVWLVGLGCDILLNYLIADGETAR
jgi:hypothetical protein